ncbi:MAG: c-type cytochrome [Candidatus Promineifilaceae bacterium]
MDRRILKWIGIVLGCLLGLLILSSASLYALGTAKFNKEYSFPVETVAIPTDAQSIERGQHLATIFLCTRCHSENLGGELFYEIPGMLTIPTPNLTSGAGGVGAYFTDQDWVRAIRHGVGYNRNALFIMESKAFYYLTDDDLSDLLAYVKSVPPVDNQLPARSLSPLGRVMMGARLLPPLAADEIDHNNRPESAPTTPGITPDYGRYLAHTCTECHGPDLNGAPFGPPGQEVMTPNLTPGGELGTWTEQDFLKTMHTGVTPAGTELNEEMPWKNYGQMTGDELDALWLYLQSLPRLAQAS